MGKMKRIVLIVAVAVGVGAVGAAGVALRAYDEATKIDRSAPRAVLKAYLDAEFVRRDEGRAALYRCEDPTSLANLYVLRDQLAAEEKTTGVPIKVVIGAMDLSDNGSTVIAPIEFNRGAGLQVRTTVQTWRFTLVDEDGWRVCGAEQIPTPSPSATPPTAS